VERAATANWSNPSSWRVHAYHPESWGNWGFEVGAFEAGTKTMTFARGGNQEARGGGDLGGRYFAGMLEELDAAHEFHHDTEANKLYWAPPASSLGGGATPAGDVVAPRLARLIEVVGADALDPAANITISGLTLRHTAPTFCCDHDYEVVSGGDWSIHRGGMVFFENATGSTLEACTLDAPGGNGVFLSGFSDGIRVLGNEIAFAGDSLVAATGKAAFLDGRGLSHPMNAVISHNHLHDWGVWGKQTSAYFGGITRSMHFTDNVVYNGPRAGINQNDGFAGASEFARNLVFNTVYLKTEKERETQIQCV